MGEDEREYLRTCSPMPADEQCEPAGDSLSKRLAADRLL